ncbi:MAG: sigma-70 family RNA polymerase sigma factor [Actinomycetota bacterium]|nr:sigma-70 family RNA polymerase sigma factor [Actinomycetota bacterium]
MYEPDPDVVAAAKGGERHAFEQIVRSYQADVWRLAFHLLHDEMLADDATQEAFVRAFRFLQRYRGDSKFSTWLFSIARNCALDEGRRAGRRRRVLEKVEAQPRASATEQGTAIEVREAVASLPIELREPIVLIDMMGSPYKDVASVLGLPEGTIKSRVHRARALLVEMLGPSAGERSGEI